jgi:hypothetical protein
MKPKYYEANNAEGKLPNKLKERSLFVYLSFSTPTAILNKMFMIKQKHSRLKKSIRKANVPRHRETYGWYVFSGPPAAQSSPSFDQHRLLWSIPEYYVSCRPANLIRHM